jgi:hypothetical protein
VTLVNPGNVLSDVSHSLAPRSKTHLPTSLGTPTATQQGAIALPVCVLRSWLLVFDLKSLKVSAISAEPTGYWKDLPVKQYLVRTVRNHLWPPGDRDRIFGVDFVKQVRDMGIHEVLSAPRSPWQRAYVERVITPQLVLSASNRRASRRGEPCVRCGPGFLSRGRIASGPRRRIYSGPVPVLVDYIAGGGAWPRSVRCCCEVLA